MDLLYIPSWQIWTGIFQNVEGGSHKHVHHLLTAVQKDLRYINKPTHMNKLQKSLFFM